MTGRTVRGFGLALAATLLGSLALLPLAPALAAQTLTVTASTPGDTAVRNEQSLDVEGTVPGPVGIALLEALDAAGVVVGDSVLNDGVFRTKARAGAGDFLEVTGTSVEGRVTLDCLFSAPENNTCAPVRPVRQVRLVLCPGRSLDPTALSACRRDAAVRTSSDGYRVDYTRPFVRGYEVIAPNQVRVVFSEPVRHPQRDSPLDWEVSDPEARVLMVTGGETGDCVGRYGPGEDASAGPDGCTRILQLDLPLAEGQEPLVAYVNEPTPDRARYTDSASNAAAGSGSADVRAVDKVLPALPSIDRVAEDATTEQSRRAASHDRDPEVVVSGLTRGQEVLVVATAAGGARSVESGWRLVTASTMTIGLPPLGAAGEQLEFTVRALARDDAGNVSSASDDKEGDGRVNPVTYLLDAVAPRLTGARSPDSSAVLVTLSETVEGSNDPADWTYRSGSTTSRPTGVTGSGAERRLTPGAPDGTVLAYEPASTSQRYRDVHGNPLAVPAATTVSRVGTPAVEVPAAVLHTRSTSVTLAGAAAAGTVEVFRDRDGNGQPDGDPALATASTSGGRFSVAVPLPEDGAYDLLVVLATDVGRSTPARAPRVVRDTVAPAVDLQSPSGGEAYAGGSVQQISYSATDSNPQTVRIEASYDDGRTWELVTASAGSSPYSWTTPRRDSEQTLVRVLSQDLAGNSASDVSSRFVLDATPPAFTATTVDSRTVLVRLSEPVTGSSTALDWRVAGERVSSAEQTTEGGVPVVRLTTGPGVTIGPDDQPPVTYEPTAVSLQYRDRAGQLVVRRQVLAEDRILPAAATVTSPTSPVLTGDGTQRVTGRAAVGDRVELLDPFGAVVAGPAPVAADGTWSLDAPLAQDSANDFRARTLDRNGNRSATAAPVARIEQDATDPVVSVSDPRAGTRLEPGQRVLVRWTSRDRNLQDGATLVEASTDAGATWSTLGERQPADGSLVWTVPSTTTPDARLRVSTPDRAGRTGRATVAPLGIGAAPASAPSSSEGPSSSAAPSSSAGPASGGSPSSSASASPGASSSPSARPSASTSAPAGPPLPPLQVAVPDGSVTPGQLAAITVTGRPGARVELQAYSRPSTRYVRARTGVLDTQGRLVWSVRPGTNTRLFVRDLDGRQRDSRSAVVSVRTAMSLTVVRNGRRDYTFQGRILPRRAGQLITLYRVEDDGVRTMTAQLRTDATGTYRLRRVFTGSGRFGFLTRTGANLTNVAGESNDGRARPTEVF